MCDHLPAKSKLFLLFGSVTIEFSFRKAKGRETYLLEEKDAPDKNNARTSRLLMRF